MAWDGTVLASRSMTQALMNATGEHHSAMFIDGLAALA